MVSRFSRISFSDNFGLKQKIARRLDLILSRISTKLMVSSQSVLGDLYKINKKLIRKQ